MIREEYTQMHLYDTLYPIEFVELDAELEKIDHILDENPIFLEDFNELMKTRAIHSSTRGRGTEPAEVILRMLILRRTYNWSFRGTIKFVNNSLSLRKFTRLYYEDVPYYSSLCRYDHLVTDDFLQRLNAAIVGIAKEGKVTRGRKMRTHTTVVESDIICRTAVSFMMVSKCWLVYLASVDSLVLRQAKRCVILPAMRKSSC